MLRKEKGLLFIYVLYIYSNNEGTEINKYIYTFKFLNNK